MRLISTSAALAGAALLAACGQGQDTAATNAAAPAATAEAPAALPTTPAAVDATDPAGAIRARQSNLKALGAANKAMADEIKKSDADMAVIQASAQTIGTFAPVLHTWFPAGTGMEVGVKTAAKPEVWAQPELFKTKADAFVAESGKFTATVASGDKAAIEMGVTALGATCKSCHEVFRQRDN